MTVGFGVRNYQNLEQGLTEMKRVLRTNGRLVILEVSIPKNVFMKFVFNIYFNSVHLLADCFLRMCEHILI